MCRSAIGGGIGGVKTKAVAVLGGKVSVNSVGEQCSSFLDSGRGVRRAFNNIASRVVGLVGINLYTIHFFMGPWMKSKKRTIVSRSSSESEYRAMFHTVTEIMWVKQTFCEIGKNVRLTTRASDRDRAEPSVLLLLFSLQVISSSLLSVATLIDILLSNELETSSENISIDNKLASKVRMTITTSAEKLFSMHNCFLDFLKHKSPAIRSATYSALTIYIKNIPHAYNEGNMKSLSAAILSSFQEKDISCHSSMWDMILLFSRKFPDTWCSNNIHKTVLNQLWQFLRNGCYGSQRVSYPALLILLESMPPKAANGEQFLLLFFRSLWTGRNSSHSDAECATFFKAFKECFLWALDNAGRLSKSEDETTCLSSRLVNDILIMLLWYDYLQLNSKNEVESILELSSGAENIQLSDEKSADMHKYSSSYIKEWGKCIIGILSHVSLKRFSLLQDFCATFAKDCLSVLQHRMSSNRNQQLLKRIINFFLLLGQFPLGGGQTWPWELLAGPLIASSFNIIKTLVIPHHVSFFLSTSSIWGARGVDNEAWKDAEYLLWHFDDFVPWCLLSHSSSSGAKLDLLISLIQDEYLSEQWSSIITHFAKLEKGSRTDFGHCLILVVVFHMRVQKDRARGAGPACSKRSGPGCWSGEKTDATKPAVARNNLVSEPRASYKGAILGGSVEDDKICFISTKTLTVIFEEIMKILVRYLTSTSFHWTRHSCSLLSIFAELTVSHNSSVVDTIEMAQFAFHVLEGSFFCLEVLHENDTLISSILATIFIIDWECNMSSVICNDDHFEILHETGLQPLPNSPTNSDSHKIEKVDTKLALARRVHVFRNTIFTDFSNILSLCNLSKLRNILIQTIKSCIFETVELTTDVISSLCSTWVMDLLKVTCKNFDQFQLMLDQLLSEANSWPLWVTPFIQDQSRTATFQRLRASHEIDDQSHGNFVSFVDKLISKLGVRNVIVGCTEEASVEGSPSSRHSYSRVWLAAELLCTWKWKGGNALSSIITPLSKHAIDYHSIGRVKIISFLVNILFDGAVIHCSNDRWIAFCTWITSEDGVENIEDPFLRALVFLMHTFMIKNEIWGRLETADFIKHILDKLFINNNVDRACLRILPYVLSFVLQSLVFQRKGINGSAEDAFFIPSEAVELYDNIIKWHQNMVAFPPLCSLEIGNEEVIEWIQVVLACYPLKLQGGPVEFKVEVLRKISEVEKKLLLSLFRKHRSSATVVPSTSNFTFVSPMQIDMIISKLTAVTIAYCWEEFTEEDWSFVMENFNKWLEPSVLLMEEMAEDVEDTATACTTDSMEVISKKFEDLRPFDPSLASVSSTALISYFLFSEIFELTQADSFEILQSIKHGKWIQIKNQIMENVLRLFFTTGVAEAIAESCCKEASMLIASSRLNYSLFWSLIASCVINTPEHVRSKAFESMEIWGLSKGPISSLYAILFSSKPPSSLQIAAYRFLSTNPILHLSVLKENCLESNGIFSDGPPLSNNLDGTSGESLCLRDEISHLILKPATELPELELTGNDRVNVFLSWALFLTHLHLLPSSSPTRERLVQFLQDSVSSTILDCLFQHIPFKVVGNSLKKKHTKLNGDALKAANAAKHAINTGSLLSSVESLWPIGSEQMASLAGSIYGMMIQLLPSYVRNWFTSLRDRSMSSAIEFFTKVWCSPSLLADELSQVKETVVSDENFSLTVNKSAYEIVATYKKEETGMDLVIRLPSCYPLRPVDVECTRSLGISDVKQRKWLLSLTAFVRNQNGAIAEAIRIWKSNFDKEFDGVEECPICYSIIHTTNHNFPRLPCKTCKHKFHSACLYKWFSTSHKSTCPLCQTPF
ncbi:E3 ubiquitin-protein ligase listerin [Platanthera guangdongensis]|uniref:E3 ubiquitin-protein ligase listerin n=1 Tax=Platanthera guangdongensis TaxID=2320717 RepID=A0ABR2M9Y1_9ASPA